MDIWKYIRKEWRLNSAVFFFDIIGATCTTLFGLGSADILTEIVQLDFTAVFFWVLVLAGVSLLWAVEIFLHQKLLTSSIQKMDADIRHDITARLMDSGYAKFHQHNSSVYVSWLTNDINTINEDGFECIELAMAQAVTITMSIATIVSFHYSLIITIIILLIIMYFVPKLFSKIMNQTSLAASKSAETATKKISDFFSGFDDLLVMNLKRQIIKAVNQSSSLLQKSKEKQATASGAMLAATNLSSLLSQTIVIGQACLLYVAKLIPIGGISAARYFAATIFANTTGMLANLMDAKMTAPIFEKYVSFAPKNYPQKKSSVQLAKTAPQITLDAVTFCYHTKTVLKNCSFTFTAAKKYLLTGDSGTGKTTILDLIALKRILQQGNLFFGHINYSALAPADIYEQIMYIRQKPHIFNETLRFNLTLGMPMTDEKLKNAIKASGLESLIAQLPNGLNTYLKENGENLSGGQVQRIALARGLVQEKRIWLVDEATSYLDLAARQDIEDRLMSLKKITLIMVSHNISQRLQKQADKVIRLVNGRLIQTD